MDRTLLIDLLLVAGLLALFMVVFKVCVDRPTVVFYADARIVNVKTLEEGLRHGVCRQNAPLSAELLRRIQDDLFVSRFTPDKIEKAFKIAREKKLT